MSDLRQSLQQLVEHPPATPASVEVVAARASTFRRRGQMQRGGAALLLAAAIGSASLVVTGGGGNPGVVLWTEGDTRAGYIAEAAGGYVATGTWQLTITRGTQVIELSSAASPHCAPTGHIQPGDEVRGSIVGRGSTLRVGEKFRCPG